MTRVLIVALLVTACAQTERPPSDEKPKASTTPARIKIVDGSRPRSLLEARPADIAGVVNATYRVRPDRRFLMAVADVNELLTGRPCEVRIAFSVDRWQIDCDGHRVGDLPELPTFSDALRMLSTFVTSLATDQQGSSITPPAVVEFDAALSNLSAPSIFRAIQSVTFNRGLPDGSALTRVSHAMVLLNLLTIDRFELADPLRARALALAAITQARQKDGVASDDAAFLAHSMGYETEANAMAKQLPGKSLARAWVTRTPISVEQSTTPLEAFVAAAIAIANAHGSLPEESIRPWLPKIRTLGLRLLLSNVSFQHATAVAHLSAGVIANEVDHPDSVHGEIAGTTIEAWLESIARRFPKAEKDTSEIQKQFESALPSRAKSLRSSAAPEDVVRAYYESLLYASIDQEFQFNLKRLASLQATEQFLNSLAEASPLQKQIKMQMSDAVAIEYRGGQGVTPQAIVTRLPLVGPHLRARLLLGYHGAVLEQTGFRSVVDDCYMQLDSRPEERLDAGKLSMSVLDDPLRRERYTNAALEAAPNVGSAGEKAWFAFQTGDRAALRALATNRSSPAADRALAIHSLDKLGGEDSEFVDAQFQNLFRQTNYDQYPLYAGILNRRHEWQIKEKLMRAWLTSNPHADSLSKAYYVSSLGKALESEGRYDEAWSIVEPSIPVWSASIITTAVSVLQRRGLVKHANQLGYQMIERYSDAATRADFAIVLWRERQYDEGAQLFDPKKVALSRSDWYGSVPERLADAFTVDRDLAAPSFQSLIRVGLPADLLETIPTELLKRKEPAIAFALADMLATSRRPDAHDPAAATFHLTAYRALKQAKTAAAAHQWLREHIPDEAVIEVLTVAYQQGEYDVIAELASPRVVQRKNDEIELFLAAALVALHAPSDDPRWTPIIESLKGRPDPPDSLRRITRYLAGLIDDRTFQTYATTPDWRCSVHYFTGAKLAASGDYDRALPHLLAAAEWKIGYPPQAWADSLLNRWITANAKWDDIKKRRIL